MSTTTWRGKKTRAKDRWVYTWVGIRASGSVFTEAFKRATIYLSDSWSSGTVYQFFFQYTSCAAHRRALYTVLKLLRNHIAAAILQWEPGRCNSLSFSHNPLQAQQCWLGGWILGRKSWTEKLAHGRDSQGEKSPSLWCCWTALRYTDRCSHYDKGIQASKVSS